MLTSISARIFVRANASKLARNRDNAPFSNFTCTLGFDMIGVQFFLNVFRNATNNEKFVITENMQNLGQGHALKINLDQY